MVKALQPNEIGALTPMDIPLRGGVYLYPSRFQAPFGSLTNVRNFEVVDGGYEESHGLTMLGPTLSTGLTEFWHADIALADVLVSGTVATGDTLYWYAADGVTPIGTARIYYYGVDATSHKITIDRVTGASPRRATSFYTQGGGELEVSATGDVFVHQSSLGLSWTDYTSAPFLGSLFTEQSIQSDTWDAFKPDPLGVQGISGVFQIGDDIYAVRDFWGGNFWAGEAEPKIGDQILVNYGAVVGSFTALVAGWTLTAGSWEEGDAEGTLWLKPSASTSLDMSETANWNASTTIENVSQGVDLGECLPQTSPPTVRQYLNKGLLWKLAGSSNQGGWQMVDMGYSLSFEDGAVAPLAQVAPLIVTDQVDSITESGYTNFTSPATEYPTSGTYSAWSNLGNMDDTTPGVYASTTIATNDYSRVLEFPVSLTLGGESRILGVEVQLTCHQTVGTDVLINKVQLRNDATGALQYLSANRAENNALTTTPGTQYTFGSQLDTWELEDLNQTDIEAGSYTVIVQFENTSGASTRTVNVDLAQVNVHYAQKGQNVYFWNGSSDVAEGNLYAYQVFDGDWSTNDAEGWITLYDVTFPSDIIPGTEIRTAASGGGDLIAYARTIETNLLPSLEEMDDAGTIYQSRKAVFGGEEDDEAAYVTTGVGPAFTVDAESRFSFIRLPIDRSKDKPKYVEVHRNHLMLATGAHVLVSSIGAPNNFNTYDGATTWNPKDQITGLAAAANGTTMIACQDSIHLFAGSGATGQDAFAMKTLTDNSGARDYTITNLLGNVYVDYSGLTTVDISDKYGGFDIGRRAPHAKPLFERLLGRNTSAAAVGTRLICGIPVRSKNQYRMYLSNGEILTATFPEDPSLPIEYTRQNYTAYYEGDARGYEATFAPTAMDSSIKLNGDESVVLGTRLGHVMKVDPDYMDILSYADKDTDDPERNDDIQIWKPFKFLDLSPLHADDAAQIVTYKNGDVFLQHSGYTELAKLADTDYALLPEVPILGSPEIALGNKIAIGDFDTYTGQLVDEYFTWWIDEATDGLSLRLSKFGGLGSTPLRLSHMRIYSTINTRNRNRIHKGRDYTVSNADIPADIELIGIVGTATASGNTGTFEIAISPTGVTGAATASGGSGGTVSMVDIWTFDTTSVTFDETPTPTMDGTK